MARIDSMSVINRSENDRLLANLSVVFVYNQSFNDIITYVVGEFWQKKSDYPVINETLNVAVG